jgi:hypothetical protein
MSKKHVRSLSGMDIAVLPINVRYSRKVSEASGLGGSQWSRFSGSRRSTGFWELALLTRRPLLRAVGAAFADNRPVLLGRRGDLRPS